MRDLRTHRRPLRTIAAATLAASAAMTMSACGESKVKVNLTIKADALADTASKAIAKQVGQEFKADCGTKPINLIKGNVIHCKLGPVADPNTVYDATVTLTKVDGRDYRVNVQNSQEPISPDATLPPPTK